MNYLLKEVNRRSQKQRQLDRQIKDNQKELSQKYAKLGGVSLDDETENDADDDDEEEKPRRNSRNSRKPTDRKSSSSKDRQRVRRLSELDAESMKSSKSDRSSSKDRSKDRKSSSSKDRQRVRRLSELDAESMKSSKSDLSSSKDRSKDRKSRDRSEDEESSSSTKRKSSLKRPKSRDKETVKQKLLDDIINLKKEEKAKQKEIDDQLKQIRGTASSSSSRKSKESSEKGIGLFLESSESLYDNSGNLLSENSSVKYIGKANGQFDPIKKSGKNKSLFNPNDYDTDAESGASSKRISFKDTEKEPKQPEIDERELMEILHAVECQEAEKNGGKSDNLKSASKSSVALCSPGEKTKYFYNGKEVYIDSNILLNKKAIVIVNDEIKDIRERDARIKSEAGMDDFYQMSVLDRKKPKSIRFSDELKEISMREVKEELASLNRRQANNCEKSSSGHSSSGGSIKRDEPCKRVEQQKSEKICESRRYANVTVESDSIRRIQFVILFISNINKKIEATELFLASTCVTAFLKGSREWYRSEIL